MPPASPNGDYAEANEDVVDSNATSEEQTAARDVEQSNICVKVNSRTIRDLLVGN